VRGITVGFAGMTHLGLVSATGTCAKGFRTICFDVDGALIGRLNERQLPVSEPELVSTIETNGVRQSFTSFARDLGQCDIVYIAPDVPTDDKGRSALGDVESLIEEVNANIHEAAILVVLCQVPPGFTRKIDRPAHLLFYQVETLIFGRAMERTLSPERFIVGCADPQLGLEPRYKELLQAFSCPILPMRYESAELAKISINMCLVACISVANTLAELCEEIGAEWAEIVPALKLDRRIGEYSYLSAGLGIAGGNLERDLSTVIQLAAECGTDAGVIRAFVENSAHRKGWAARVLRRDILPKLKSPVVAVWGLAYKENTHSVKNSPSVETISLFKDVDLRVHDPIVSAEKMEHPRLCETTSAMDALRGANVLMILTPWAEYKLVEAGEIAHAMRGNVLIDPYKVVDSSAATAAGLEYHTLGVAAEL